MIYLAIQTFAWLALTAGVFFGLGYAFHRRFARARVVVSDQPPMDPPPPHRPSDEFDKVIRDLRTRLLEKERDLAELLESVPQSEVPQPNPEDAARTARLESELAEIHGAYDKQVARNREIEARCLELAQELKALEELPPSTPTVDTDEMRARVEGLMAEVALKTAQAEAIQIELDRLRGNTVDRGEFEALRAELAQREAELLAKSNLLVQREADLEMARQEAEDASGSSTVIASLSDSELNELREELDRKVGEISDYQKRVETLEAQLYEREYLLQVARSQQEREREDLARAADAIWEDSETDMEEAPLEIETLPVTPASTGTPEWAKRMEEEFRQKISGLESTIENLRNENEMALLTALEMNRALDNPAPEAPAASKSSTLWEAPPEFIELREREAAVDALWQAEKDAEKERLRRSVENLKNSLDAKEKAIEDLGQQLESLSGKLDPKLVGDDNLELIKGIGPFTRKLLEQEFGITSFAQLANLSSQEQDKISERLFFKNQIERDDWRSQARDLHRKKYGETP